MISPIPEFYLKKPDEETWHRLLAIISEFDENVLYNFSAQKILAKKVSHVWKGVDRCLNLVNNMLRDRGYALIHNVPYEQSGKLSISFCALLGNVVEPFRLPHTKLLKSVRANDGLDSIVINPHTDSTDWPKPNDVTILECIESDINCEGKTRVVAIKDVINLMHMQHMDDIIEVLCSKPIPFEISNTFGGGVQYFNILSKGSSSEDYKVRYIKENIESCIEKYGLHPPPDIIAAVATLTKIIQEKGWYGEALLKSGDLLLFDNLRVLHWRTPLPPSSNRYLRRIKLDLHTTRNV